MALLSYFVIDKDNTCGRDQWHSGVFIGIEKILKQYKWTQIIPFNFLPKCRKWCSIFKLIFNL